VISAGAFLAPYHLGVIGLSTNSKDDSAVRGLTHAPRTLLAPSDSPADKGQRGSEVS
jgi:hypothetical protein